VEEVNSRKVYPEHIYDPLRRRIATEIVEKELMKFYPSIPSSDLTGWSERFDEHNYWGAVEGIIGSTLLKPIMLHFLTARNFQWQKRDLPLDAMQLSSKLNQLNRLGDLDPHNLLLSEIKQRLEANPEEMAEQKRIIESFSSDSFQNRYPIIAREREGRVMVLDGNRRALRALLAGQSTIEAWYCQTNGQEPRDYWYPIADMMRLVRLSRTSEQAKSHVKAILEAIFEESTVARIAYTERIVKVGTKGAGELLE
jgi:hypothetical protein